jgi:hypothetical protein
MTSASIAASATDKIKKTINKGRKMGVSDRVPAV